MYGSIYQFKLITLTVSQHRGIFLTYPPSASDPALFSGTLFHASYINHPSPHWILESREVKDLSISKSLVLLYRIASYSRLDMMVTSELIGDVLRSVPLGKEARSKVIPGEVKGNAALGGYDCVIVSTLASIPAMNRVLGTNDRLTYEGKWTNDALEALIKAGLADFRDKGVGKLTAIHAVNY